MDAAGRSRIDPGISFIRASRARVSGSGLQSPEPCKLLRSERERRERCAVFAFRRDLWEPRRTAGQPDLLSGAQLRLPNASADQLAQRVAGTAILSKVEFLGED